jgi:hypothetical protein
MGGPGVLRYYCTLHGTAAGAGMAGVLMVGDVAGSSAEIMPIKPA